MWMTCYFTLLVRRPRNLRFVHDFPTDHRVSVHRAVHHLGDGLDIVALEAHTGRWDHSVMPEGVECHCLGRAAARWGGRGGRVGE